MKLYTVDADYVEYLKKFDDKVPDCSDSKVGRPFVGVVFNINNIKYFAPLTSPKPKFIKMKNAEDFIKINNGRNGAINLNNMIPVHKYSLNAIDLSINIDDSKSVSNYKNLLIDQASWLNGNEILIRNKAEKLYYKITNNISRKELKNRCVNYKELERAYILYNEKND